MFEPRDRDDDVDAALRQGLRLIPEPHVSPDFDAKVLERLSRPEPWGQRALTYLRSLRPAFGAAAVTVPLALLLITLLGRAPALQFNPQIDAGQSAQALPLEQALDRPDLSPSAFRRMSREETAARGRNGSASAPTHAA